MVSPLNKQKVVKKRTKKFLRHFATRFKRISTRASTWRAPRGIDSVMRRRWKGRSPLVNIGYGTQASHRHLLPNGFLKFRVQNVAELELLLMHNRKYAAEIAAGVSSRNRKVILERAAQLDIKVTNAAAKVRSEEDE